MIVTMRAILIAEKQSIYLVNLGAGLGMEMEMGDAVSKGKKPTYQSSNARISFLKHFLHFLQTRVCDIS